jgi:hypothetical protein
MSQAEVYRELVEARAGGACEYCRLLQAASGVTFHIEHALPRARGGETVLSNLVFSCPGCNLTKSDRTTGEDDASRSHSLFNPRNYEPWLLGWHLHFAMEHESGTILPRTPVGQATVNALRMNDRLRVFARRLQITAGLIA